LYAFLFGLIDASSHLSCFPLVMMAPKKKTKATSTAKSTAHASSTSIRISTAKPPGSKRTVLEVLDELDLIGNVSSSSEDEEEDGSSPEDEFAEEHGDGDTSVVTPQVMTPPGSAVSKKRKRKSEGTLCYEV